METIKKYSLVGKRESLFCYINNSDSEKNKITLNDIRKTVDLDFQRLTIPLKFRSTITEQKGGTKMPKVTYVNLEVSDAQLKKISHYRREGRFPTVCYFHTKTGCALYRSAEPNKQLETEGCSQD